MSHKKKYRTYTKDFKLEPSDLEVAQAEIRRSRRKLAIAEQERDILNKP